MPNPRKPTALKILHGDPKSRMTATTEPEFSPGLGPPPDWFGDDACHAWDWLRSKLEPTGVATEADQHAAMIYARTFATWMEINRTLTTEGLVITDESVRGIVTKAHPLLPSLHASAKQMMACLSQFGMTPSARASLGTNQEPPTDPLVDFMRETAPTFNPPKGSA